LYVNQQEEARKERVERDKNWRLYQDALAKIKELEARPTTNPKAEALYKAVREATK
jgi:hypothetical protein